MSEQLTCADVKSLIETNLLNVLQQLFKDYFKTLKTKYTEIQYKNYWEALMIAPLCTDGDINTPHEGNETAINDLCANIDDIDQAFNGIEDVLIYLKCMEFSYLISKEYHKSYAHDVPDEITFQMKYDLNINRCSNIYHNARNIRALRNLLAHNNNAKTPRYLQAIQVHQNDGVWCFTSPSSVPALKILYNFCEDLSFINDELIKNAIFDLHVKIEEILTRITNKQYFRCKICRKKITEWENNTSINSYGKPLCPDCMKKQTRVDDGSKKIDECSILENTSDNTIKNIEIKKAEPDEKPINTLVPISQVTPQLIIFLVDMSESMGRVYSVNPNKTKAEVVTEVLNTGLYDLFASGLRGQGYKNYFYVCVKGYYGSNNGPEIIDLFACNKDTPPDIKKSDIRPIIQYQEHAANKKDWLIFTPGGTTPMLAAFNHANKIIGDWEKDVDAYVKKMIPGTSIPADRVYPAPIIISISDGHYTNDEGDVKDMSASPVDVIEEIQQISSKKFANKPPLVFNFLISGVSDNENDALIFPAEIPENSDFYLEELFSFSSSLPPEMIRNGFVNDEKIKKNAKGLMYKASVSNLIDLLKIGTRVTCLSASNNTKHPIDKGV